MRAWKRTQKAAHLWAGYSRWTPLFVSFPSVLTVELRGGHRGQTRCVEGFPHPLGRVARHQ